MISKRIFHQLDWYDRGCLYRFTIEDECRLAVRAASIPLNDAALMQLILSGNKNRDGKTDRSEFIDFIDDLIKLAGQVTEAASKESTENANVHGDHLSGEVSELGDRAFAAIIGLYGSVLAGRCTQLLSSTNAYAYTHGTQGDSGGLTLNARMPMLTKSPMLKLKFMAWTLDDS